MNEQHFDSIASILNALYREQGAIGRMLLAYVIGDLSGYFKVTWPNFDRQKFIEQAMQL